MKNFDNIEHSYIKNLISEIVGAIFIVFAYGVIFRIIDNTSYAESKAILYGLLVIFILLRTVIYKGASTFIKVVFCLIPLGIYTVMAYFNSLKYTLIILLVTILMCFIYVISLVINIVKNKVNQRDRFKKRWLKKYFLGICIILAFNSALIIGPLVIKTILGLPLSQATTAAVSGVDSDKYTLSNNFETVSKLYDGTWELLSNKEKLNVLQTIVNIENNYLGLPYQLYVCAESLDEKVIGNYDKYKHRINLNKVQLEKGLSEDLLYTVCHECFHAYEQELIILYQSTENKHKKLLLFNNVPYYMKEFSSYVKGGDDYDAYKMQKIEMDANTYAINAVNEYRERIKDYLKKENCND